MPWIKKNPHLLTLLIVALLVIAGSAVVAMNAKDFNQKFADVQHKVVPGDKIEPLDTEVLDKTQKELDKPATWTPDPKQPLPFVPVRYRISPSTGQPEKAGIGKTWPDRLTGTLIDDKWFMDNRLPVTDPTVPSQDPDGDGFFNDDEWRGTGHLKQPGTGSTDPNDPKSHPPYYTKLYLARYERVPFLLKFNAYDGDPKKDKPEDMSFQINTLSVRTRSQFLKIGDKVVDGKFTIKKFEFKMAFNPKTESEEEASELTLVNNETNAEVVLVLAKVIDSPDSFAIFHYVWTNPPMNFRVPKLQKFVLLPNKEEFYQLLDITEQTASIKTPSGETITIEKERPPAVPTPAPAAP
jgi:hypothetical protein